MPTQLDDVFGALTDATRRAILAHLATADARVTDLAGNFPISLNSTSKHIRILERAGLVRRTVVGRDHLLSLNAAPLADAADWIEHYREFWTVRLAALDAFVQRQRRAAAADPTTKPRSKTKTPAAKPERKKAASRQIQTKPRRTR